MMKSDRRMDNRCQYFMKEFISFFFWRTVSFCGGLERQEVKIVVVVLAILTGKIIAAPASEEHAKLASKSRNVRQTGHERCPEKDQRKLEGVHTDCPWYYCVNIDENRLPVYINVAMCLNSNEFSPGFQCERVLYNMEVHRKSPGDGENGLIKSHQSIPVACVKTNLVRKSSNERTTTEDEEDHPPPMID
ncbi:uncharacterized protein LOC106174787 isoform X1 [Lingula anatina]|uniref:Uncharacterized protein LOC106174787 isoform X1 n=1 Tax=Lingula anatina TaxID=7574 RepID=A0A1S3JNI3_LINAN|nr:uncharacterized protein LOC106174787 isoform X1 [Lingula anatina]|eukprot:XP_013411928.1 uncharacterized protein LOC106174787 isoform X1 [Lingula anatina]